MEIEIRFIASVMLSEKSVYDIRILKKNFDLISSNLYLECDCLPVRLKRKVDLKARTLYLSISLDSKTLKGQYLLQKTFEVKAQLLAHIFDFDYSYNLV
jgi:hypothetical protein